MKIAGTQTIADHRRNIILSVNPKAGRRSSKKRTERLASALRALGFDVDVQTDLQIVAEKANALHAEDKLRALIGIGGDGTAAELTNRTVPGVPIALLPSGTANILAKHLKYSFRPEKFARMIAAGRVAQMDAAQANGRIFLAMIGCGFDAEVVAQVHDARMRNPKGAHINYFSYIKPILKSIASYPYPKIRTEILDSESGAESQAYETEWAFLANLPRYGWGVPLAPRALFDDGLLDLTLWRGGSLYQGLKLALFGQLGGLHRFSSRCTMEPGKVFRFSAAESNPDAQIPYQLDGDPAGMLPVDVKILERRLTIFVP